MFENKVFICLKKKYVCQIFPDKGYKANFLSNLWVLQGEILPPLKKLEQGGKNVNLMKTLNSYSRKIQYRKHYFLKKVSEIARISLMEKIQLVISVFSKHQILRLKFKSSIFSKHKQYCHLHSRHLR